MSEPRTPLAELMARPTALYRFFAEDGTLIYIGITVSPKARDYQHAAKSPWWPEASRKELHWYTTWREADVAEKAAILAEQPRYNIAGAKQAPPLRKAITARGRGMSEAAKRALRERAAAARRAPDDLLDAMVEAAEDGATNLDIAREIEFFYNPDYIGKLISKKAGPRKPGRRPRRE